MNEEGDGATFRKPDKRSEETRRTGLTTFEHLSQEGGDWAFEAIDLAMEYASFDADGFAPFATVLAAGGGKEILKFVDVDGATPSGEEGVALARRRLRALDRSTRCVALAWDGYLTLDDDRTEAVYVQAYELGRPVSVLLAQRYQRRHSDLIRIGNPVVLDEQVEPLVPVESDGSEGYFVERHTEQICSEPNLHPLLLAWAYGMVEIGREYNLPRMDWEIRGDDAVLVLYGSTPNLADVRAWAEFLECRSHETSDGFTGWAWSNEPGSLGVFLYQQIASDVRRTHPVDQRY